jgi:hypothetical protein
VDSFKLIQNFFTRMSCQYCQQNFEADDIELIREDHGIHVVGVHCQRCNRQVGVAMVGVDASGGNHAHEQDDDDATDDMPQHRFADPELTEDELERLAPFAAITDDDVLDAHHFFAHLGADWANHLPMAPVNAALETLDEALVVDSTNSNNEPLPPPATDTTPATW